MRSPLPAMPNLILFNKPFNVLCQFSGDDDRLTLKNFLNDPRFAHFYPAGRLDYDSEGLLLLTCDGQLQHRIANPRHKMPKVYWVQVEGEPAPAQLEQLRTGVRLKDGMTAPAMVQPILEPTIWDRTPPIRHRRHIPTSWLSMTIFEGRNRQVRRMTAAVGLPTLRLIRYSIGDWKLGDLKPGVHTLLTVSVPGREGATTRNTTGAGSKRPLPRKPRRNKPS